MDIDTVKMGRIAESLLPILEAEKMTSDILLGKKSADIAEVLDSLDVLNVQNQGKRRSML